MMPGAEPRAGTTPAAEPDRIGSEIVDLTDTALDDPTAAERGDEPDAATPADRVPAMDVAMQTDRRDRLRKVAAIVFVTVVVLGAAAVTLTRSPFFAARTIDVRGASHVPRSEVLRIAAVAHDTNVFTLDAGAAERRLERDPWITEATVTKDLPSTLVIDIHERIAVAVAESDGVLRLVADDGALLDAAHPRDAVGTPSIVMADADGVEPSLEAVGERRGDRRDGADAAQADRRRLDPAGRTTQGRPVLGGERGLRRRRGAAGESDGAASRAGLCGGRERPSLCRRAGALGPDRGAHGWGGRGSVNPSLAVIIANNSTSANA